MKCTACGKTLWIHGLIVKIPKYTTKKLALFFFACLPAIGVAMGNTENAGAPPTTCTYKMLAADAKNTCD